MNYIMAVDQGTTSSRALIFNQKGHIITTAQEEFKQHYPQNGWVEHDLKDIWQSTEKVMKLALSQSGLSADVIKAIGITNQRETTCVWNAKTGEPLYRAIVWQDRRTASHCEHLRAQGIEKVVTQKTGLLLDPYFSATKIAWILEHVPGARKLAEKGECLFGTVDSYLLWQLTNGKNHLSDATNASRTLLFNIHHQQWDDELLSLFQIPKAMLPEVRDCASDFGVTTLLGKAIPITAMIGDQQSAAVGQACIHPGMVKSTYGTGCFMVVNTGEKAPLSKHRLLSTTAYRLNGKVTYALEGSIFVAGAAIQWLRDGLKLIQQAKETESLAASVPDSGGVVLVPAFTGLGAPYWDPNARGAILGITRDTSVAHIVRATLEAIAFQTRDLLEAVNQDCTNPLERLRVDGGMVDNAWFNQYLSDTLHVPVERPQIIETTALGAAFLAGLGVGLFSELAEIQTIWHCAEDYQPKLGEVSRQAQYAQWLKAVGRVRS